MESESKANESEDVVTGDDSDNPGGGSWFGWLSQAKETAISTMDSVKRDLTEFGDTVTNEAASLYESTSAAIRSTPGVAQLEEQSGVLMRGFVSQVNNLLTLGDTTEGEEDFEVPIVPSFDSPVTKQAQGRLFALQTDPDTYLREPEGAPELFEDWLDNFSLEMERSHISHLLTTVPEMRRIFANLVPSEMSDETFWHRYFYRVHQWKLDEARRSIGDIDGESAAVLGDNEALSSWGDGSFDDLDVIVLNKSDIENVAVNSPKTFNDGTCPPSGQKADGKTVVKSDVIDEYEDACESSVGADIDQNTSVPITTLSSDSSNGATGLLDESISSSANSTNSTVPSDFCMIDKYEKNSGGEEVNEEECTVVAKQ